MLPPAQGPRSATSGLRSTVFDVSGLVGLALAAFLLLGDEPDDRRIAVGELCSGIRGRRGRHERDEGGN